MKGFTGKKPWSILKEALREAIINAVIHRDYIGAHTQLKIFPDRLILWNEGGLPKEIAIEDLKRHHPSRPKNELLADVFFKAGLIETWGRGTLKIVQGCIVAGLPEPEFREEFGGFSIYFSKDIYTVEKLKAMGLNERQIRAVMYAKEKGRITNKEYQHINNDISRQTATIELKDIVNKKLFIRSGVAGRGIAYSLTKLTNN